MTDEEILRQYQRLRRMCIVAAPKLNLDFGCFDTMTVEGGWDTGYAINRQDCGKAAAAAIARGACCVDEVCEVLTAAECTGIFLGNGTSCVPNPCLAPGVGACCVDETCSIGTFDDCASSFGEYQGDGTDCGPPNPCVPPVGACCFDCDPCEFLDAETCISMGGAYQGPDTTCEVDTCPAPTGACCQNDFCSEQTEADCNGLTDGVWQGCGVLCEPNPCPSPTGACCVGEACSIHTADECTGIGGTYQGNDTTCVPNPCPTMPSCGCGGFDAFDGSGRRFLTRSVTVSVRQAYTGVPACTLNYSGTESASYDPITCVLSPTSCSGSGDYDNGACGIGSLTIQESSVGCCIPSGELACGNCPGACDVLFECTTGGSFSSLFPFALETSDDIHKHRSCSNADSDMSVDITLSDECIPT